ncbi:hypothetical protein CFC21_111902 [Triticum aestivum]|uniref:Uncharacterized protein n=2 Tax=Triticum aestivum TaxID=4565 RepID=A0A3B6U017_WHEAT|nr:disease resistance protein RGA5-like [Triticum aestivum]XP_044443568.1 disease resistance protein RGA5-like [Triticum aestivum]KAF7111950.1 hypothetical protein CFC21_111902 [Triticum aestivum]
MEVVTGAMTTLLPTLAGLLKEEYDLHKNTRGEIRFLKAELESMETALLKISEAPLDQQPDVQVKLWAKEVRELSYEIEDSVDKFLVRLDRRAQKNPHSFMGFIHKSIDLMTKAKIRHKMGTEIKDIRSRIKEVSERRDRYKVDSVASKPAAGSTIESLRLSALYKEATELIGTEDKENDLVKRLTEGDAASKQQLKIVSVVGFGGLGKTTLANVVYQKLKSQFDCEAFVSLSLNPNMKNILRDMLHQLEKHNYSGMSKQMWGEAQLVRELRDFLLNKRYLIVIDDIWKSSAWKTIKHALIENKCGSRIITTTRNLDIAKQIGGVYVLKPLTLAHSRKLFCKRIFGTEDKCPPNQLAEVSHNIIKRCGGVPLAIMTIASMLASKKGNDWSKVYQAMGSGLQDSPDVKDMRRILSVSYYDLPPHLKTCLLSISFYPEDYKILARDLIWRWIGEGFVREEHGKSLYEIGEDYFSELINKSLIQPADITNDKASACRVHDMVLDLITSLSREENFLTYIGGQQPVSAPSKVCRLSVQSLNEGNVKQMATMSVSHLRSLSVFEQDISLLPALSSFSLMRALDLSYCSTVDNRHAKVICNMFHLRHLWLCKTNITQIPDEIGNLQFLQVLDVSETKIQVLPAPFVQLTQLVYLHIGISTSLPEGMGNLKSLQELKDIYVTSPSMLHGLSKLTELRNLCIRVYEWNDDYKELFRRCLSNLVNLKTIKITGVHRSIDYGVDNLSSELQQLQCIHLTDSINFNMPRWISSLSNLSTLLIQHLETLREEDLQVLGNMPSLRDLDIWVVKTTYRRQRMVINSSYPFQCLARLKIGSSIMELKFAQGAMQRLETLEVILSVQRTWDQFGDLDFGLENLSSLKQVYVGRWYDVSWSKPEPEEAGDAIWQAVHVNPNKPTLEFVMFKL